MNSASVKLQHNFFLVLLILTGIIIFYICRPFLAPLVIAGSFAIVFHPVFEWIAKKLNNRRNIAALITVLLIILVVLGPFVLVGSLLFNEARNLYISVAAGTGEVSIIERLVTNVETQLKTIAPDIDLNVDQYVQNGLQWILSHLNSFFSSFLGILIGMFLMVFALFFLLRDGRALKEKLFALSPLKRDFDQGIMNKLIGAVNSVIKGSLVIATVQGVFAGIGFAIAGVPNPILWGVAAIFASLIPGIGTALVTVPWIIYLFITQPIIYGIGLAIWAGAGIGLIDNFLAPYVLNRGIKIHPFLIFISVIGGLTFFGPIGFILGPVMFAFFFALLDIYPLIFQGE
jgi:predicted PurR-regulated permease PerM